MPDQPNGQPVQVVQPAPIPASITVGHAQDAKAGVWVVLGVMDATGTRYVFMEPSQARMIGDALKDKAREAGAGGLVIPASDEVVSFEAMRQARRREGRES